MGDKSLSIFLMMIFGISGIAVLMLAWLWSTLVMERIAAIFAGATGLFIALTRIPVLKQLSAKANNVGDL